MRLKRSEKVYLFEDGKLCRSLIGSVVKTRYKDALVQLTYNGEVIQKWFKPYGSTRRYRTNGTLAAYLAPATEWFSWYTCVSERKLKRQLGDSFNHYDMIAFKNSVAHLTKD